MLTQRLIFRKRWISAFIILVTGLTWIGVSHAETASQIQDDSLIFEVHLDHSVVADGLNALRVHQQIFLPLGEIARIFTIAITTDPVAGTASGFIINEARDFTLNVTQKKLIRSQKSESVDSSRILLRNDDIYVESQLLSQWLPIDLNVDTPGLTIQATAREPLPLQAKMQRDKVGAYNGDSDGENVGLTDYQTPYRWIDRPFIDQTVTSSFSKNKGVGGQPYHQYTTALSGDMLGLQSNLFLTGDSHTLWDQHRLTMGRDDPDARLLGPLKSRSFSIGAASLPGLKYVAHADTLGTGAVFSNRYLTRPTRYDSQSFSGTLLPGWDVELFQNGLPIRHQQNAENGRYLFDDVPLLFGMNDFRLIFHGPQGQVREEHTRFLLEDSLAQPGEFFYSAGVGRMSDGSFRTILQFDRSIVSNISATAGVAALPVAGQKSQYFNLGLRSFFESVFLSGDSIFSSQGGRVESLGARTALGTVSISLTQAFFQNFSSELFQPTSDPITLQTKLRMDSFIPLRFRLPVSLELNRDELLSGIKSYQANGRVSTYVYGLSITNMLQYQLQNSYASLADSLQLGRRIGSVGLRGGMTYNVKPIPGLALVDLNAEKSLGSQYTLTESITSQFPEKVYRYVTSLNKGVGQFGFGINGGWSSSGETFVGARLNIALGMEPRSLGVFASAEPVTSTGALSARVYVDKNMNGEFDDGDKPLSGVGFRVDGGQSDSKTDEQGIILLHHLPSKQKVNIALDPATIDDPQMTPGLKGVRMLPRPGRVATVDFPIQPTTEVDGTLFRYEGGKRAPAANVEVELVDENKKVISSTKSSFDGFYILSSIPPGKYDLRVSPAQAERLNMPLPLLKTVRVLPGSAFISGLDSTISIPTSNTRQPEAERTEAAELRRKGHRPSRKNHLFYVAVGTFADPANIAKIDKLLVSEHLNFQAEDMSREVPVYRVRVATVDTQEKADELVRALQKYGYTASVKNVNGGLTVYTGPYYSEKEAKQERAILGASQSSATVEINKEMTLLTRFTIGGFAWRERAQQIQARLIDTGLIDESLIVEAPPGGAIFYGQGKRRPQPSGNGFH